jgi:hypothetical protein
LRCVRTINGVIEDGDPQGLRLVNAAVAAFSVLDEFGFRIGEPRVFGGRGADVLARSDHVSISVTGDWYDRELFVAIKVSGARWLPVDRLLPELSAATRRLPRNAKRGVLQKRLEQIAVELRLKAPEVLTGGPAGLARVLQAGAKQDQ